MSIRWHPFAQLSSETSTAQLKDVDAFFILGNVSAMGGAERRLAEAVPQLCRTGLKVAVVVIGPEVPVSLRESIEPFCAVLTVRLHKLALLVRLFKPTVAFLYGRRALLATLVPGFPVQTRRHIMQTGLDYQRRSRLYGRLLRSGWIVDTVICNSASALRLVTEGYRVPLERVALVESSIDADWLESELPTGYCPDGIVRIGVVGNFRKEKNLSAIASALGELKDESVEVTFFSSDVRRHRELMDSVGLKARYVEGQFLRPADFDELDILFHPSVSESLSRAVIEALARGVVIVTGSVPEIEGLRYPHIVLDSPSAEEAGRALSVAVDAVRSGRPRVQCAEYSFRTTEVYCRELLASSGLDRA